MAQVKTAKIIIMFLWSFIAVLFLGSIIALSIPAPGNFPGAPAGVKNGWAWLGDNGVNAAFKMYQHQNNGKGLVTHPSWWYDSYIGIISFSVFVSFLTVILISVVPILSLIFGIITWQLVVRAHYPKSITFIDAIHRRRRAFKKGRKLIKKFEKKLNNNKVSANDLKRTKDFWKQEQKMSQIEYLKEKTKWDMCKKDPAQMNRFFKKEFWFFKYIKQIDSFLKKIPQLFKYSKK